MIRPRSVARHLLTLSAFLLSCLAVAVPAAGQGVDEMLSGPMSTRQILRFADRLELSNRQREALVAIHDEYKTEFRALREGEIAAFTEEMSSFYGSMMPQRETVERFMKKAEQLQGKIKLLDERVFDRLAPLLTEDQAARLPRVRLVRERERCGVGPIMGFVGNQPPDISEIFFDLQFPPNVVDAADPLLEQYERRLTANLRKLSEASGRMLLDMYDAVDALGFGDVNQDEMLADPELMQEMMEAMQAVWGDLTAKAVELTSENRDLNRRTFKSVSSALGDRPRRRFRDAYFEQTYPQIASDLSRGAEWVQRALKRKELTDEQRAGIEAALADHHLKMDGLADRAAKVIDENRDSHAPFDYDEERWRAYYQKINELQTEAGKLVSELTETAGGIVGEELAAKIGSSKYEEIVEGAVEEQARIEEVEAVWAGDEFVAPRIGRRDIRRFADRLRLDENALALLQSLHMDYAERHKNLEVIDELTQARRQMWKHDESTGQVTPPTDRALEKVSRLRREAAAAVRRLDEAFFEDVSIAIIEEPQYATLEALRASRLRRTYRSDARSYFYMSADHTSEGGLDLGQLLDEQELSAENARRIEPVIARYHEPALDVFRARWEAQLELQETQDRFNAMFQRAAQEGDSTMSFAQEYMQTIGPASERLSAAERAVAELNRKMLGEMIAALDADAGGALRRAYNLRAFPTVYEDPASVDRHLTAAAALENLQAHQRDQLNDLAAAYRPEYERLSREMIELSAAGGVNFVNFEAADWQAWQQRQEKMQAIRFDRDELNFRAISRLRTLLHEEQIQAIGGLPEPVEDDQRMYFP